MNVMISYGREDKKHMATLDTHLRRRGIVPWVDHDGIRPGARWRTELLEELKTCDAFIPVISQNYLASEHCRMEIFIARSFGRRILPLMVEDCFGAMTMHEEMKGLDDLFMMRLYRLHAVGLPISKADALDRIADGIGPERRPTSDKLAYISYSTKDAAFATAVATCLEAKGIPTWVATLNCRVGDNWRDSQARAMMRAFCHVVVLDENIVKQDVLRTEILLAEAQGLPTATILPPRLTKQQKKVAAMTGGLHKSDLTYRRLADVQFFGCADGLDLMIEKLSRNLLSLPHSNRKVE